MATLRWGICATGRMSSKFMVGLNTLPEADHQVVAVAARSEADAAQFAQTHNIPHHYGSYAGLAACDEVSLNVALKSVYNRQTVGCVQQTVGSSKYAREHLYVLCNFNSE